MNDLDSVIEELFKQEPYWNICHPCQNNGYCCIGANILANSSEWSKINESIQLLSSEERQILKNNIANNKQCIFRMINKCLIHDIRPANCRYTPYQVFVDPSNTRIYTMVRSNPITNRCEFRMIHEKVDQKDRIMIEQNPFVSLPNFENITKYISLNWCVTHCSYPPKELCVSEWMKIRPLL